MTMPTAEEQRRPQWGYCRRCGHGTPCWYLPAPGQLPRRVSQAEWLDRAARHAAECLTTGDD